MPLQARGWCCTVDDMWGNNAHALTGKQEKEPGNKENEQNDKKIDWNKTWST